MRAHVQSNCGAGMLPADRAGDSPAPSGGPARRRRPGGRRGRLKPAALKLLTYSILHLCIAITLAFALTGDWRIALGVGVIEPIVQTVAYMLHEKAWARLGPRNPHLPVS